MEVMCLYKIIDLIMKWNFKHTPVHFIKDRIWIDRTLIIDVFVYHYSFIYFFLLKLLGLKSEFKKYRLN